MSAGVIIFQQCILNTEKKILEDACIYKFEQFMHTSVGKKLKMLITNVYTFKKKSTFTADNLQYIRLS